MKLYTLEFKIQNTTFDIRLDMFSLHREDTKYNRHNRYLE